MPEKIPGAKEDKGKLQMSIVPPEIITAIAEVRRYGLTKYAEPANWQRLDPLMLHEALLRHCVALWTDWTARDPESGLPHLWHLATNAAFLCWFLKAAEVKGSVEVKAQYDTDDLTRGLSAFVAALNANTDLRNSDE